MTIFLLLLALFIILFILREGLRLARLTPSMDTACCQCDRAATHFPEDYDEYCDECFEKTFDECPNCNAIVYKDEIGAVQSAPQTHWSPAEYDTVCVKCTPSGPDEWYEDED